MPRLAFLFTAFVLMTTPAHGTLSFDLRVVGGSGPKSYTGLSVNQVVNLELYAVVTGATGNAAQEGFQDGWLSILSTYGIVRGNLSGTLTTTYSAANSQNGTSQDLDGDGDKDLGSPLAFRADAAGGPAPDGNYIRPLAAAMQTSSGAVITDGREFKLANLTFTVTNITNPLDPTPIQLTIFVANFKSPINVEAVWQQDGIQSSMTPTPGGTFPNSFPTVGSPVLLRAIPEPATVSLLLLSASGLATKRWRKSS